MKISRNVISTIYMHGHLISVTDLKIRWKSLKDCYLKHKKAKMRYSKTKPCYRDWRWAKHLHFLEPLSYHSRNSINLKSYQEPLEMSSIKIEPESETEQPDYESDPTFSEVLIENSSYNEIYTDEDHQAKDNEIYTDEAYQKKDNIYHLFHSYSDTFRKLSPKRQILLKIELAKLFYKAELEQINEEES